MKFAEIHCHTMYSNSFGRYGIESLTTPEQLLKTAKIRGLSAVAITDHNTMAGYEAADKLSRKYGIVMIPAEEFDTDKRGQLLGFGIRKGIEPFRPAIDIIKDIHDCGGVAIVPHPFVPFFGMENIDEVIKYADGLEVLNFGIFNNRRAYRYAKRNGIKVITGGSDAHHVSLLGNVVMGFPDGCHKVSDYVECLRQGLAKIQIRSPYLKALLMGGLSMACIKAFPVFYRSRYLRLKQTLIQELN